MDKGVMHNYPKCTRLRRKRGCGVDLRDSCSQTATRICNERVEGIWQRDLQRDAWRQVVDCLFIA